MAANRPIGRLIGFIVGAALLAGVVASVFLIDWTREPPEVETPVRPLMTLVVGDRAAVAQSYPARVRSLQEVTLAFEVAGVLRELPVVRGQRVAKGDMVAQLDLRDFQSRLDAATAQYNLSQAEFRGASMALERGAATQIEVSRFGAARDLALAQREIAEKSLEDATLYAPFDALVADVFVDAFQSISPHREVLRLQDNTTVRVEINVHEGRVAFARRFENRYRHAARFDFLPGQQFDATLVEYTTEADRATQTFKAIFEVVSPEGATILPGMTATIVEIALDDPDLALGHEYLPIDVVGTDGHGARFVWRLQETSGGEATVSRVDVKVGGIVGDSIMILEGVRPGDRVAAAGVQHLAEGQRVRPMRRDREATTR